MAVVSQQQEVSYAQACSFIGALGVLGRVSSPSAQGQSLSPPGKMVNVGGYTLHLNCSGKGRPTVVLEGGAGAGFSFDWALVQPEIAKTTRVCSYDRAGYAWSEPGPEPRTLRQIASQLFPLWRCSIWLNAGWLGLCQKTSSVRC